MNNTTPVHELFEQRDVTFPIEYLSTRLSKEKSLWMHWHNDLELIYVKSGQAVYTINGYTYQVQEGDLIIINPKQVHQAKVSSSSDVKNDVIILNYNLFRTQMMDKVNEKYILPLVHNKFIFHNQIRDSKMVTYFQELKHILIQKDEYYELDVKSLILSMISYLFKNNLFYENKAFQRKNEIDSNDLVRQSLEYIHNHYESKFTLDDIGNHISVSKYHLCRVFKQNTGTTLSNYINKYRLQQAKAILDNTKFNITQIAFKTGFNSSSYFISKFKEEYGISPSKYRKKD